MGRAKADDDRCAAASSLCAQSGDGYCFARDLFRRPVPTFRDHALLRRDHLTATGATVEPLPPWIFSGCMMKANS